MTEETIQAARRAWANDPEAAAQALLGCSAEELFITALRGCNQHKHKPGCPDADRDPDVNKNGYDFKTGTMEKDRINGAKIRRGKADKIIRRMESEEKKHEPGSKTSRAWRAALQEAGVMASNIRSASRYIIENPSGSKMRKANDESRSELMKLSNLYHRTALELNAKK